MTGIKWFYALLIRDNLMILYQFNLISNLLVQVIIIFIIIVFLQNINLNKKVQFVNNMEHIDLSIVYYKYFTSSNVPKRYLNKVSLELTA